VASGANLLVLDEPTNHLDLESREALEAALEAFPGTVLLVSHDRALLDAVAERTVAIEEQTLRSYDGGWADLVRTRAEASQATANETARVIAPKTPKPGKPASPTKRRKPTELERVETRIGELERHIVSLEQALAADWTDMDTLTSHRAARDELQTLLARWEELFATEQTEASPSS
jgi:ATP-binding cassette, subfamily F, member 3